MNQEKKSAGFFATVTLSALLGPPLLYLASIAPAGYLLAKGVIDEETLFSFYAPLRSVTGHLPESFGNALEWYLSRGFELGLGVTR